MRISTEITMNSGVKGVIALAAASLIALSGCGKSDPTPAAERIDRSNLVDAEKVNGCIQGVIVNGLTGERVDLPKADAASGAGIMVRVRDQMIGANSMAVKLTNNAAMKGEYSLCGIPLEDEFPLYVQVDGFQAFITKVKVSSTVPELTSNAQADIQKPAPTKIVNVRLYPVGVQTQDLKIQVFYAAHAVKGATVQLVPNNANFLDGGDFATPINGELMTQSATTGDDGIATFAAAGLVIGGHYDYNVIPAAGAANTASRKSDGVTIGLLAGKGDHDPYLVTVNLDDTAAALAVVSESREPNAAGIKTCVMSRPVELVKGTEDGVSAAPVNAVNASLKEAIAGNDSSESANIAISADGYTITLSPVWNKAPDLTKEPQIAVQYAGIVLKPRGTPDLGDRLSLADKCNLVVGLAE